MFRYTPDLLTRYPNLRAGVILASNVHNGPTPEPLLEAYLAEQRTVIERIGKKPLSEIESLAAWRAAFRLFGVDPTQYRSASEALLRRLTKKGDIPSINAVVDLCNLVSIRYALPVAAFDLRSLVPPVTVQFAKGDERYTPLGEAALEHPVPGEVIFADETGLVIARRWCHRQSEESAAREDTTQALITVEAHHARAAEDIQAATDDLLALMRQYASDELQPAQLGPQRPAF
jgi:DNA/RNA-binding domain of Phe-tRNA-synthetase-like protein